MKTKTNKGICSRCHRQKRIFVTLHLDEEKTEDYCEHCFKKSNPSAKLYYSKPKPKNTTKNGKLIKYGPGNVVENRPSLFTTHTINPFGTIRVNTDES